MDDVELRDHLLALEVALATRDSGTIGGPLAALIADDFVELGASGATWDAATVRSHVDAEPRRDAVTPLDFTVDRLAEDAALVTYRLGPPRATNRSSIWVRRGGRWLIRFHQATPRSP